MSITIDLKLFRVSLFALICLVSLSIFISNGYCDDWVHIGNEQSFTMFYNKSTVKIDKQKKTITVWEKRIYTEKGKIGFLKYIEGITKQKYNDFQYILLRSLLDYKQWKARTIHITGYSKTNKVLFNVDFPGEWEYIDLDSISETLYNQLLRENHIKR